MEHVMEPESAFREIHRVLKPGGVSLHNFPSKWRPIEPHMFIPFGGAIQSYGYMLFWALLGVRNHFQKGLPVREAARRNYLILANRRQLSWRCRAGAAALAALRNLELPGDRVSQLLPRQSPSALRGGQSAAPSSAVFPIRPPPPRPSVSAALGRAAAAVSVPPPPGASRRDA